MSELIKDGGGLGFKAGNADDLARVMRGLIDNPARLLELKKSIPRVKTIEENASELMNLCTGLSGEIKSE